MVGWVKQKCNDLLFKIFPILPSYIARECYEEFDEKYKEFRIMTENKRFTYLDASRSKYIGSFFCNGIPLTNQEVADFLNENEQLKKEILWWKYRCGEDISGDVE